MEIKVSDLQFTPEELKLMSKELKMVDEYNDLKVKITALESDLLLFVDEFTTSMIKQELSAMKKRSKLLKFRILNFYRILKF